MHSTPFRSRQIDGTSMTDQPLIISSWPRPSCTWMPTLLRVLRAGDPPGAARQTGHHGQGARHRCGSLLRGQGKGRLARRAALGREEALPRRRHPPVGLRDLQPLRCACSRYCGASPGCGGILHRRAFVDLTACAGASTAPTKRSPKICVRPSSRSLASPCPPASPSRRSLRRSVRSTGSRTASP